MKKSPNLKRVEAIRTGGQEPELPATIITVLLSIGLATQDDEPGITSIGEGRLKKPVTVI